MKKRILFLMSDTGGGHRAAAQAIEESVHYLYPNSYDIFIEDIWRTHTPWPVNKIPDSYSWFTGPGLPLWKLMWRGSTRLQPHKIIVPGISPLLERKVIRRLQIIRPDVVVSVHPFMNHLGIRWRDKLGMNIPFVTVVTDMVTVHPLWICPQVTCCIVPTKVAQNFAVKLGMPPAKIEVCGQPVGLKFMAVSSSKTVARQNLNLDTNRCTVLVVGGAEGVGRLFDIARAIAGSNLPAQLLVVAGRNKSLKKQLEATIWEIPTQIFGFVDNMPELMKATDILVTKAGPGTISEAFISGLPPLISGYIPGQEQGNVTYVQKHDAGTFAGTPQEVAQLVSSWTDPGNTTLKKLARNAARLAKPEASLKIAAKICNLV